MVVQVLLFASWADTLGVPSIELRLRDDATAGDVLAALHERAAGAHLARPAVAVNRRIASTDRKLAPGDEIAVIPPVAGG